MKRSDKAAQGRARREYEKGFMERMRQRREEHTRRLKDELLGMPEGYLEALARNGDRLVIFPGMDDPSMEPVYEPWARELAAMKKAMKKDS